MARMGPEKQVHNTIPFSHPDPLSPSSSCSWPSGWAFSAALWAALLPGFWVKKWFLHLEALAGDWRGEDHEGIRFIPPGLFWPPGHLCRPPGGDRVCQKALSYSHSSFSWVSSSVLLRHQAKGTSQFWVVFPKSGPHLVNSPSLNSPSSPM